MIRYFGAFAPYARDRAALTGRRAPRVPAEAAPAPSPSELPAPGAPPPEPHRPIRLDWAALLKRVHKIDVLACRCGGRLQVIAFLTNTRTTRKILDHLGIPVERPAAPPARAPPQPLLPGLDGDTTFPPIDPPSPWG